MPTYSSEWDKGDYRANNEQRGRMGFGGTEHGGQQFAQRSRMLGDQAQGRASYQSDFSQGNQSRGITGEGVNLALSAARGQQPSAAEILARRNTAAGVRAGQSMAAGIKGGPGARVAAMRNAQRMGAQQIAEGGARAEQLRAQEMADARGQVIQGGTAMRQGDHDAQRIQQANELTQRGLNDTQQRFFEQQGFNTQVQDQNNQLGQQQLAANMWKGGREAEQSDEQFGFGKLMKWTESASGAASGAIGGAAGSMTSDEAAKNLIPAGSLAPLMGGGRGAADAGVTAGAPASFDKLTPGGGMDVTGSLKAHSNFATKFQRDPSGGMMSDWRSKDVMYSPGEIKDRVDAPAFLAAESGRREDADPYMRVADTGVTGAPRGYAAARDGHAGAMFGQGPDVASGYEKQSVSNQAPGTDDWQKYGAGAAKDGPVDWKHGGSTTPQGAKPNAVMGSLAGFLGGLSGGARMRSDMTSKNEVMYSDDKTKLKEAFEEGAKYADASHAGVTIKAPDYAKAPKARNPAAGPAATPEIEKAEAEHRARAAAAMAAQPKPVPMAPPAAQQPLPIQRAIQAVPAMPIVTSDEQAKNVVDLDEPAIDLDQPDPGSDKSRMRDGSSEPRIRNFDESFRRDTPADQKRVKRSVENKASKDADAMMAGFGASLKKGPSARVDDVDSDDKPDLASAADASKGQIPDDAMYRAMKSMQPSLYSYKPGFKPPEQRPGEVQAGPMANPMKKDPIAGLAVEKEPSTGLLAIDKDKALKLTMGSLAVLAQDVEEMKRKKGARK
jgi:hypothetical protein